jgi:hypothetical protein
MAAVDHLAGQFGDVAVGERHRHFLGSSRRERRSRFAELHDEHRQHPPPRSVDGRRLPSNDRCTPRRGSATLVGAHWAEPIREVAIA